MLAWQRVLNGVTTMAQRCYQVSKDNLCGSVSGWSRPTLGSWSAATCCPEGARCATGLSQCSRTTCFVLVGVQAPRTR